MEFRSKLEGLQCAQDAWSRRGLQDHLGMVGTYQDDLGVQMRNGYWQWRTLALAGWLGVGVTLPMLAAPTQARAQEPIRIGHVAALSGASAQ